MEEILSVMVDLYTSIQRRINMPSVCEEDQTAEEREATAQLQARVRAILPEDDEPPPTLYMQERAREPGYFGQHNSTNEPRHVMGQLHVRSYGKKVEAYAKMVREEQFKEEMKERLLLPFYKETALTLKNEGPDPQPPLRYCCCTLSFVNKKKRLHQSIQLRNVLTRKFAGNIILNQFQDVLGAWKLVKFPYPVIFKSVMAAQRLQSAIDETIQLQLKEIEDEIDRDEEGNLIAISEKKLRAYHWKRAHGLLKSCRSALSDVMLRISSWVLFKVLPWFLDGVVVNKEQIELLQTASSSRVPVIFLPQHKSHLDYILMTFILLNNGVKAPLVATEDNLRIPVLGQLFRRLGAFFVKRKVEPEIQHRDLVYRAVLHTYMTEILHAGHFIEFSIEGTRSCTGKMCVPKGAGLLSVILDALQDSVLENAFIVPVSINYELLVDSDLIHERRSSSKVTASFWSAVKAIWRVLNSNYGSVSVGFSPPLSLKHLVRKYGGSAKEEPILEAPVYIPGVQINAMTSVLGRIPSSVSLYGIDVVNNGQRDLVGTIARHVMYDCNNNMTLMCTNAVAFLLLTSFREGASLKTLSKAVQEVQRKIKYDRRPLGFDAPPVDVVNRAISMLGPRLIQQTSLQNTVIIKPVTTLPNVMELSYYGNCMQDVYKFEAIVATAAVSLLSGSMINLSRLNEIGQKDLFNSAIELCNILQFELVFTKPCQSLDEMVQKTIFQFSMYEYLQSEDAFRQGVDDNYRLASDYYLGLDDDSYSDDDYYDRASPRTCFWVNTEYIETYKLYCYTLRPLLETYCGTATGLTVLIDRPLIESVLINLIKAEIQGQLSQGRFLFNESVCTASICHALQLFENWGVIKSFHYDQLKVYHLTDKFSNPEALKPIINKFQTLICTVTTATQWDHSKGVSRPETVPP